MQIFGDGRWKGREREGGIQIFFFICICQKKVVSLQPKWVLTHVNLNFIFIAMKAKPFVKWVGGKTQLIDQLEALLPADFDQWENVTYIEPFVGGGAMLFYEKKY